MGTPPAKVPNASKHGLYGKTLRNSWKLPNGQPDPETSELHDEMDVTTALDEEIKLARVWITRYQNLLADGKEWVNPHHGGGQPLSVHHLLDLATNRLRRLVHTQHEIKPGSDVGSNLRVSVHITGANGESVVIKAGKPNIPNLTEDEPEEYAPENLEHPETEKQAKRASGGYDDDGDPDA